MNSVLELKTAQGGKERKLFMADVRMAQSCWWRCPSTVPGEMGDICSLRSCHRIRFCLVTYAIIKCVLCVRAPLGPSKDRGQNTWTQTALTWWISHLCHRTNSQSHPPCSCAVLGPSQSSEMPSPLLELRFSGVNPLCLATGAPQLAAPLLNKLSNENHSQACVGGERRKTTPMMWLVQTSTGLFFKGIVKKPDDGIFWDI